MTNIFEQDLERNPANYFALTPLSFIEHLRTCKLYDYTRQQWLDFDGNPTSKAFQPQ